jgi:DNA-binding transcriptional MerR regulator
MDKSPDAFRTISEVADWLGTPAHVLRFWESRFSQVKPVKRAGGRRYYRPSDMVLLGGIKKLLHDDGMTIRGVQKLLREHGVRYVAAMSPPLEGVDPVALQSDSPGPIPAAPMAEDVPTGAFDLPSAAPEEKILPFSRPDIPAQPAPNASPTHPTATPPAPAADTNPPTQMDPPEAPMIDVDAPFAPTPDPVPLSAPAAADQPPLQSAAPSEPPQALQPDLPTTSPSDAMSPQKSAPIENKPAQVPFDFNAGDFNAGSMPPEAPADLENAGADIVDDETFETALQAALTPQDDAVEQDLGVAAHMPSTALGTETALPESAPLLNESAPQNTDAPQTVPASATDAAPQFDPSIVGIPSEYAPDVTPFETPDPVENPIPAAAFNTPSPQDITEMAETSSSDNVLSMAGDAGHKTSTERFDVEALTPVSAADAADIKPTASQPIVTIPDDPEDTADGLDVINGVLGQLNKKALSDAEPQVVQAIFDRAMALNTKLFQAR